MYGVERGGIYKVEKGRTGLRGEIYTKLRGDVRGSDERYIYIYIYISRVERGGTCLRGEVRGPKGRYGVE